MRCVQKFCWKSMRFPRMLRQLVDNGAAASPLVQPSASASVSARNAMNSVKRPQNEEKGRRAPRRGMYRHVPQNLKSLYGGYKLITCLTSLVMVNAGHFTFAKSFLFHFFIVIPFLCVFFFFSLRDRLTSLSHVLVLGISDLMRLPISFIPFAIKRQACAQKQIALGIKRF